MKQKRKYVKRGLIWHTEQAIAKEQRRLDRLKDALTTFKKCLQQAKAGAT